MSSTDKFRYPKWVKPRHLLIGDLKYQYAGEGKQAIKMYWDGSNWIHEKKASSRLIMKSDRRKKFVEDNEQIRKTGQL